MQRETKVKEQAVELQRIRDLLREHLHVTLKNARDLREMNLKLFKVPLIGELNVHFIYKLNIGFPSKSKKHVLE